MQARNAGSVVNQCCIFAEVNQPALAGLYSEVVITVWNNLRAWAYTLVKYDKGTKTGDKT